MEPTATTGLLGTLGINAGSFIAQLVDFAIVVLVMWRFVYRPLVKMMDERTKEITDGLENAKRAEQALSSAKEEQEQMLQMARAEAHQIVDKARADAEAVRKEKLAQEKQEIEKIATEAKQSLRAEREAAFNALKGDIGQLVALAAEKVAVHTDTKGHRELIERAVKDLEHV